MKYKEIINKMVKAKDRWYRWDRGWLEELEYYLLSLWLLVIDEYRRYKRLYHNIESKKLLEYAKEREKHTSDLQTIKALNKKYKDDIEEMEIAQDSYKVLEKYYDTFSRYANALNSTFIHDIAMAKRSDTEKNF